MLGEIALSASVPTNNLVVRRDAIFTLQMLDSHTRLHANVDVDGPASERLGRVLVATPRICVSQVSRLIVGGE